jgi:MtrB/PioB family decaheme-associated outer membrane protein
VKTRTFRTAPLAAAVLAALTAAHAAEDDEIAELVRPQSTVSAGVGYVDEDNRRFGQYTGMTKDGAYGLFDADIVRRNDATGTWLRFTGRNLGLEHRGLRFEHERQGNWGYFIDFSQTPRNEPYVAFTNVGGIGTPNLVAPTVLTATPGGSVELGTRRDSLGAGFQKYLGGPWSTQVRLRHEEKEGSRIFARGTTGTLAAPFFSNFGFTPEPISSTTRQLEALVNYTSERLQLSGGYYGTAYDNEYKGLFITGGIAALQPFSPIALPPDNESHQLHVNGGFQFTPTTRATFRLARARATQRDQFLTAAEVAPATILPTVPSHLDGRVDTREPSDPAPCTVRFVHLHDGPKIVHHYDLHEVAGHGGEYRLRASESDEAG